ncbi:Helix-turn-helix domain-containing protein [Methylophilus rhizosphaerae]|uniref:Helix-turn-helix domain-containing protein n=1 Tax=Methylophilus rhizosphaerae TaxID=492660 RepID=A0A1G9BAX2_9PROT|nr:helix-turn-helix transcriptional regulator [Methylophilus rhizosphaerae]SDK36025.1 Helix-turn-helix domain-containing protein [Methylophilus rhizosphaerae]
MDNLIKSTEEVEKALGEQFRQMRIQAGLDQKELAGKANISLGAVMNLENGRGSSLKSVVKVVRALGREDWLHLLAPQVAVSPMRLLRAQREEAPRRNVFRPRNAKG